MDELLEFLRHWRAELLLCWSENEEEAKREEEDEEDEAYEDETELTVTLPSLLVVSPRFGMTW